MLLHLHLNQNPIVMMSVTTVLCIKSLLIPTWVFIVIDRRHHDDDDRRRRHKDDDRRSKRDEVIHN